MEPVDVRILDRDFRIAVSAEEKTSLLAAVSEVDVRMRQIREAGRATSLDRIAVMAAIQLAHELIARRTEQAPVFSPDEIALRLRARQLSAEIQTEIARQEALS
jgi:cell division protein ZapA